MNGINRRVKDSKIIFLVASLVFGGMLLMFTSSTAIADKTDYEQQNLAN